MKAIAYETYGGIEALRLKEVPKPVMGDDEVLVKVFACSLNDWDLGKMDGNSLFNRLTSGYKRPKHPILGSDIAGRIEAVGKHITKFKTGDEVYGDLSGRWGGFAQYCCATEKQLALKPAGMSFTEAASIPQAAMLAVQGLIDKGKIREGDDILVNGAGGGVGTFGVQIAKLYHARTTGVDHGNKLNMMSALGFDQVIDYTKEDFTRNGKQYNIVLDAKTNRPILKYLAALKPGGIYVTVGGSLSRLLQALIVMPWIRLFTKKRISIVALKPNKDLEYINNLFVSGKIKPVIDGNYKLEDVPEAFRVFSQATHQGKIVVTIDHTGMQ